MDTVKTSKITRICEMLEEHYGRPEWAGRENVLDELILTILSQNTTAKNTRAAFARLRERFPAWDEVRLAPVEEIADAIRVGGLANRKAPRIRIILQEILDRHGSLDLEWLADTPDAEAVDYLMGFDGVGRKTAACTLMFALNRSVLPVDTHVHRVAMRLGLIPNVDADTAHDLLQAITPPEDIYSFHVNLIRHGREICHARGPECPICPLKGECRYYREMETRNAGN